MEARRSGLCLWIFVLRPPPLAIIKKSHDALIGASRVVCPLVLLCCTRPFPGWTHKVMSCRRKTCLLVIRLVTTRTHGFCEWSSGWWFYVFGRISHACFEMARYAATARFPISQRVQLSCRPVTGVAGLAWEKFVLQ